MKRILIQAKLEGIINTLEKRALVIIELFHFIARYVLLFTLNILK